jgi:decaprenylphospho-beta-D-erythro-pentofuranosid-2-ulose 2-reductase
MEREARALPSEREHDQSAGVSLPARYRALLIGGTSEIGLAIVRELARHRPDGRPVEPYLVGRDQGSLDDALAGLREAGCVDGEVALLDADDLDSHEPTLTDLFARAGRFDVVLLAVGVLGAQSGLDATRDEALEVMRVNFLGCGSLLIAALRALRGTGSGTLVLLSTVGAERPRAANAVYGAAKAGLDALAQGLGDSLADSGVRVLVVRPGFVKTRMTASLKPTPFASTPEAVASATVAALGGSAHTVWVPGVLRYMFIVLRHLPRPIYRRLPL